MSMGAVRIVGLELTFPSNAFFLIQSSTVWVAEETSFKRNTGVGKKAKTNKSWKHFYRF